MGRSRVKESAPIGLRAVVRAALIESNRYNLGCPTEEKCKLIALNGPSACDGCEKHLRLTPPEYDSSLIPRMKLVIRWESMVNVGCKFGPNDLSPKQWTDLIMLAQERQWIDERLRQQRESKDTKGLSTDQQRKLDESRRQAGIPAPGQSLFGPGK